MQSVDPLRHGPGIHFAAPRDLSARASLVVWLDEELLDLRPYREPCCWVVTRLAFGPRCVFADSRGAVFPWSKDHGLIEALGLESKTVNVVRG